MLKHQPLASRLEILIQLLDNRLCVISDTAKHMHSNDGINTAFLDSFSFEILRVGSNWLVNPFKPVRFCLAQQLRMEECVWLNAVDLLDLARIVLNCFTELRHPYTTGWSDI